MASIDRPDHYPIDARNGGDARRRASGSGSCRGEAMRRIGSAAMTLLMLGFLAWFQQRPAATKGPPAAAPGATQPPRPEPPALPVDVRPPTFHHPGPFPDRVILSWQEDPTKTQSVTWRTSAEITGALAQIAPADGGPGFSNQAIDVPAVTTLWSGADYRAHYHTARFTGLTPSMRYAYRVGDGARWSEWFHFRTAATGPEPFSFIYFGDAQNDIKSLWSRIIREAHSDAPRARFMIHAGDLINNAENDDQWGEWFQAGGWLNGMLPSLAAPGNHEYFSDKLEPPSKHLTPHWRAQFAFPENGPPGLEETVYYLDYQGVRLIALNSNVETARQADWLERVLSKNPCRWTIVTFHHPLFSTVKTRDNAELRRLWKPVLDRHRVDLVLQGHDHNYGRTGLNVPENIAEGVTEVSGEGGTVYVVSVSGPKMYPVEKRSFMQRVAEDTQLYQIIHIDEAELRYESRTAIGDLYDAFTLKKRANRRNELVERIPDGPERRREKPAEDRAGK
jgi:acid phosphatase type 7